MDHIWRDRMAYILGAAKPPEGVCVFCEAPQHDDATTFILHRGQFAYVIMNIFPYNTGHVMVNPYRHVDSPEKLDLPTLAEIWELTNLSLRAIRLASNPHAFNLGANLGKASGGGIDQHFHFHIVPRWQGDTNFMPVIAEARVLPENLNDLYARLRPVFEEVASNNEPSS
ncbi:MAG: HIT domain-containing protein [Anaerolineae bacterium]